MPQAKKTTAKSATTRMRPPAPESQVPSALDWLQRHASREYRDDLAPRYGIRTDRAFGVAMADIQRLAKDLGRDHALACALWDTGWYEARLLAVLVDEPARVTQAQMDRWCRDFDNWAICDTACMHLFDRTPHAWRKAAQWSGRRGEFVKRAGFALIASLALHDKRGADKPFLACLPLIERGAGDERNFVKKGVSWALRAIGRRNAALRAAAQDVARRLAESDDAAARWVGKDALKDLAKTKATRAKAA